MQKPETSNPNPWTADILRYFEFSHLPHDLAGVSSYVHDLAHEMARILPPGPELTAGLRKLLEAKDCFVRAALDAQTTAPPAPKVTMAPPGIPQGCVCAYTWHSACDGRIARNGPRGDCQADHVAVDGAAADPAYRPPAMASGSFSYTFPPHDPALD